MSFIDTVNRVYREFKRYTGDGLPGEPAAAPLPIGDPNSGAFSPKKSDIRQVLLEVVGEAAAVIGDAETFRDEAEEFRDQAAASAAGVNIPPVTSGDGGKLLRAKADETGSEWRKAENAQLADMAQGTFKGRAAGAGTGTPQDLSTAQVRAIAGPRTASVTYASNASMATVMNPGASPPSSSQGTQIMTLDFAASTPTAKVKVVFTGKGAAQTGDPAIAAALFIDSETSARETGVGVAPAGYSEDVGFIYEWVPGDTAVHTYKIRVGAVSGAIRMNSGSYGGTAKCRLVVEDAGEPP